MKKLFVLFIFLILVSSIYASDDELQISGGDDETTSNSLNDDETGSLLNNNQENNNNVNQNNQNNADNDDDDNDSNNDNNVEDESTEEEVTETIEENNVFALEEIESSNEVANERETLFDIRAQIDEKTKEISQGEKLLFVVRLVNLGNPGEVEASINYKIIDTNNNIILWEDETINVETQREFIKRIKIPEDLQDGTYKLLLTLSYPGQIEPAYSEDTFFVKHSDKKFNYLYVIIPVLVIVLLIGMLLYIRHRRQTFIYKI